MGKNDMGPSCLSYTVIRDSREKQGQGWWFAKGQTCHGTVIRRLKTGDYTLEVFEDKFCIERKGSIKEFASNLIQDRFYNELGRMSKMDFAVVLCEFDYSDMMTWPHFPGLSREEKSTIDSRLSRWYLLQRTWELTIEFPSISFIYAGRWGQEAAASLFKRVAEKYGKG